MQPRHLLGTGRLLSPPEKWGGMPFSVFWKGGQRKEDCHTAATAGGLGEGLRIQSQDSESQIRG